MNEFTVPPTLTGEEPQVTLALVSHTNVGKTTLARTLLRRDVGEVLDQAHVTEVSTAYSLLRVPEGELVLWDTPGFGDSARLLARLRRKDQPLRWFFQQMWDRVTDKPLWCSQQAALTIRDRADVVLYLVNATESPEEAGYVGPELELLDWLGVPVILLLNQVGEAGQSPERREQRLEPWRRLGEHWGVVRGAEELDAFTRCWVEESLLLARVGEVLEEDARSLMEALTKGWTARNLEAFERASEAIAGHLATVAVDREALPKRRSLDFKGSKADRERGMERLGSRLQGTAEELMTTLLEIHGLDGDQIQALERELEAFQVRGEILEPERGAILGSVVSGAVGGLAADVLAGGLTFGGGVLAGAILGALGGASLSRGYQLLSGERPAVVWSTAFVEALCQQTLLRYLAVAHFGRGGGIYRQRREPELWQNALGEALRAHEDRLREVLEAATRSGSSRESKEKLRPLIRKVLASTLTVLYPEGEKILKDQDR